MTDVGTMTDADAIAEAQAAIVAGNPSKRTLDAVVKQITYRTALVARLNGAGKAAQAAKNVALHNMRRDAVARMGCDAYWIPEYVLAGTAAPVAGTGKAAPVAAAVSPIWIPVSAR